MSSASVAREDDGSSYSSSRLRPWGAQTVLSRPLYVNHLPDDLLQSLRIRSLDVKDSIEAVDHLNEIQPQQDDSPTPKSNGMSSKYSSVCQLCPKAPQSREPAQIRSHLRSEWHRYNSALVKRGRADDCLEEEAFNDLVDELSSGSSSEDSDMESREIIPIDHVALLLKRLNVSKAASTESDSETEGDTSRTDTIAKEPFLWFVTPPNSNLHIQQTQFGILRAIIPAYDGDLVPKDWHLTKLNEMQTGNLQLQHMPRDVKRFKGASAASEASAILDAVFMDASGEQVDAEDSSESESDRDGSVDDNATIATANASLPASVRSTLTSLRTWTILLMAGGNFSAVIIALNPREISVSKKKGTTERQFFILARKQIHRYTTRRKQGGAQSLQDASGKFAKSAGAQLRRYGEQALGEEIRALLSTKTWRDGIQASEKIWIRAGLRSSRGVLWSWQGNEESPLEVMRKQDRIQNLPIATRKPTTGECLRCFAELIRVRVRHDTEEELQAKDNLYKLELENSVKARQERRNIEKNRLKKEAEAREQAVAARKKAAGEKLDEREILKRERLTRLIDMIRKGRLENTISHLNRYESQLLNPKGWNEPAEEVEPDDVDEAMQLSQERINLLLPFWWRYLDAREKGALLKKGDELNGAKSQLVPSTLLQVAAEGGHANQVSYFLTDRRSDPTTSVLPPSYVDAKEDDTDALQQFPHRTAYDLCSTRVARDVFRRLMASHPEWCSNWSGMEKGGARIAKALTSEMEEAREKEEKVRDKRQAMKERARKRQEEEDVKKAHAIDVTNIEKAAAVPPPPSSATKNRLGGNNTAPRALQREWDEAANLTPEMRARIEREKRARAAEARFKALQSSSKP